MRYLVSACVVASALVVSACGSNSGDQGAEAADDAAPPVAAASATSSEAAGQSADADADADAMVPFDITSVPVSTARLGEFPYLSLPNGYVPGSWTKTLDFGHFLFWTGKGLHEVEGKLYYADIGADKGKTYSAYELKKNIDAVARQAGGVLLTTGDTHAPFEYREKIPKDVEDRMLGDMFTKSVSTYVIRREDRQIWVQFTYNNYEAHLTILETMPFEQSSALLPANAE